MTLFAQVKHENLFFPHSHHVIEKDDTASEFTYNMYRNNLIKYQFF
jgi:hypothetical protein